MKYIMLASKNGAESERERAHRRLAYEAALEGIVLLENNGALPLKAQKVALYGTGAAFTIKGGTGSGEVHERRSVSILEGLTSGGFTVTTEAWLADCRAEYARHEDEYRAWVNGRIRRLQIKKLVDSMFFGKPAPTYGREITAEDIQRSDTDTALYVVSRQAGEGADRRIEQGENDLAPAEIAHLETLCAAYKNVVLVINVGSSLNLDVLDALPGVGAVVYFAQQGMEGGTALADILSGRVSPSGKLTDTWARRYQDVPFADEYSYRNGDVTNEYYKEGIFVGYRYFDAFGVAPRYAFGHGLSYTTFSIAAEGISTQGTQITVPVAVVNTGKCAGREVAELYVSCPQGACRKEYQRLAAFAKTDTIGPGEVQKIELTFDLAEQASFLEQEHAFILDAGDYIVRIGCSSRDNQACAVVSLDARAVVSVHDAVCPLQTKLALLEAPEISYADALSDLPHVRVPAAAVATVRHTYATPKIRHDAATQRVLSRLSMQEKLRVLVGVGMMKRKNRLQAPGSVGNTTDAFFEKGLPNTVLADGPAGLRLARRSVQKGQGAAMSVDAPFGFVQYLPAFCRRFVSANPDGGTLYYQNCTAFPVEMALAQSWNCDLLRRVGEAIAVEMEEYGVTYWLAPGMNIHRNPLCGRNFEYYSEDPLLTGKLASALTRGVQASGGKYVTIKHFCCNNQEDNRNRSNSIVSERALREIYLRGFSIAVKEGGAKSVMTSYNRLNGVYTPNSYDLCTKILRNEWGFSDVVMTDWLSSARGLADNASCLAAGNDLIMPGGGYYLRQMKKALRQGKLQQEDIDRAVANVVFAILHSSAAAHPAVRAALPMEGDLPLR